MGGRSTPQCRGPLLPTHANGRRAGQRRNEFGAALTMWVLLMVPVASFAALVALAGPQRLAARSDMADAADDLADLAVALRQGAEDPTGDLSGFSMSCKLDDDDVRVTCQRIVEAIVRDLGADGVAGHALEGFYTDSLKFTGPDSRSGGLSPFQDPPNQKLVQAGWHGERNDDIYHACALTSQVVVYDAVHLAIAGQWQDAGWAAAQVWPDGSRMAAESIGRFAVRDSERAKALYEDTGVGYNSGIKCQPEFFELVDSQGRPVWNDPDNRAWLLVQYVDRSLFGD